jgi:hypothetical protein
MIFKIFDKEHINLLFTAYFCLLGVSAMTQILNGTLHAIAPTTILKQLETYTISLQKKKLGKQTAFAQ